MAASTETFQITAEQAELYESAFVPAIFAGWAGPVLDAAGVAPGQRVLDVGCGTGIAAREAAGRVGAEGHVVGLDLNDAMLAVARRVRPDLEWQQGDAAHLPFPDGHFDVVVCQFMLMFVPEPVTALREMARVVRPNGSVTVMVPASVGEQPAFGPFVDAVGRHAGPDAVSMVSAYWVLGDLGELSRLFTAADLEVTGTRSLALSIRYRSVDELVRAEVDGTPLRERLNAEQYERIVDDCRQRLARFETASGVEAPLAGHIVTARAAAR